MDHHFNDPVYIWDTNWKTPWHFDKNFTDVVKCKDGGYVLSRLKKCRHGYKQ